MVGFFYGLSAFFVLSSFAVFGAVYMNADNISDRDAKMMGRTSMAFCMLGTFMFLATMFGQWMGG